MALDDLLRGWARDVRRGNGGGVVDDTFMPCHLQCEVCPVDHNVKQCRLSESEQLAVAIAGELRCIDKDPAAWALDVSTDGPGRLGALTFFHGVYGLALEGGPEYEQWRTRLEAVLEVWMRTGWLRSFAEQAQKSRTDTSLPCGYREEYEAAEEAAGILALADGTAILEGASDSYVPDMPEMVNGICVNPRYGRPTSEWGKP